VLDHRQRRHRCGGIEHGCARPRPQIVILLRDRMPLPIALASLASPVYCGRGTAAWRPSQGRSGRYAGLACRESRSSVPQRRPLAVPAAWEDIAARRPLGQTVAGAIHRVPALVPATVVEVEELVRSHGRHHYPSRSGTAAVSGQRFRTRRRCRSRPL
jgi:hypothetical protein